MRNRNSHWFRRVAELSLRNKLEFIYCSLDIFLERLFIKFGLSENTAKVVLCSLINKDTASLQTCERPGDKLMESVAAWEDTYMQTPSVP